MVSVDGSREKSTLGEQIYAELRTGILSGRLRPGGRLKVSDLSAQHNVSLNVVREALNRLTGERLVRAEPQVGFTIADLSLEDLADLVDVRVAVESLALRRAIERGDVEWESQVVAAHHRLANTPMTTGAQPHVLTEDWLTAHAAFHAMILSGCGSPRMREILRSLSDSAEIYRSWSLQAAHPQRDLASEHAELMDAALARDSDRAVAALVAHIVLTQRTLIQAVGSESATDAPRNEPVPLPRSGEMTSQSKLTTSGGAR